MKKWIISLVMMGLAFGFTACNKDDEVEHCIVGKTVESCVNGVYVSCVVENEGATKGVVARLETVEINGIEYVCNEKDQLQPMLTCHNGKFLDNGMSLIYTNDYIFECVGNDIKNVTNKYQSFCQGNSRIYFDSVARKFTAQDCAASNKQCEQIAKGDTVSAVCIDQTQIVEGCTDTTAYGKCRNNTLIICSNSIKSKGKTLRIDCGSISPDHVCTLIDEAKYGFDCALTCGSYNNKTVTDFGFCEGDHLFYCRQGVSSDYSEADCGSKGCGFTGTYYDCL